MLTHIVVRWGLLVPVRMRHALVKGQGGVWRGALAVADGRGHTSGTAAHQEQGTEGGILAKHEGPSIVGC